MRGGHYSGSEATTNRFGTQKVKRCFASCSRSAWQFPVQMAPMADSWIARKRSAIVFRVDSLIKCYLSKSASGIVQKTDFAKNKSDKIFD